MTAYYNEIDRFAAQYLRNLIAAGHIAPGIVDDRSIEDVHPSDLDGFTQCHFFAGVGVWSYALRRAGWPDHRPVWTGSCPCQPFSAAGKGAGFDDERHLWPAFHHLIRVVRPADVIGEQVASKDGLSWLELVQADLEAAGYAVGASDLCAAGFADPEITGAMGGAHIRQRLYWGGKRLGDSNLEGSQGRDCGVLSERSGQCVVGASGASGRLADADFSFGRQGSTDVRGCHQGSDAIPRPGLVGDGLVDWLPCRDGKYRPTKSGLFPLVDAYPGRVGVLRASGNALDKATAQAFVEAWFNV